MTTEIKHTFVIPAYGDSDFIEECLDALIKQTVESRIILSTSTPSLFIEKLSKKYNIPLFIHTNRTGIASDWTFACQSCESKYVTIAHQDDIYLPSYTEQFMSAIEQSQDSLIAFSDYKEIYNGALRTDTLLLNIKRAILFPFFILSNRISSKLFKKAILAGGSSICCPSVMFNKKKIGDISFNTKMSINMDWYFWWKLAGKKGDFVFLKERLMHHRIHSASETSNGLISNRRQSEDQYMFQKIWPKPIAAILSKLYSFSYRSNN